MSAETGEGYGVRKAKVSGEMSPTAEMLMGSAMSVCASAVTSLLFQMLITLQLVPK
jgi:hypothetical protein